MPGPLRSIDPCTPETARRIVAIQRVAYRIEADLIGFDGIPQLTETAEQVQCLGHMRWTGAFVDELLVGVIAWQRHEHGAEIDRLAVDPAVARQGLGRQLVRSVPVAGTTTVSTGKDNSPAVALYLSEGFEQTGTSEIAANVLLAEFRRRS